MREVGRYRFTDRLGTTIRLKFASDVTTVARNVGVLTSEFRRHGVPNHAVSDIRLVTTEAINNIIEHAVDGRETKIVLRASLADCRVTIRLIDSGISMPNLHLPEKSFPNVGVRIGRIPEGGFGWPLIFTLSKDVSYQRRLYANVLVITIEWESTETINDHSDENPGKSGNYLCDSR